MKDRDLKFFERSAKRRDRLRRERYDLPLAKPITDREAGAIMLATAVLYGFICPSPEGISLGVLTGWLLTRRTVAASGLL